MQVTKELIDADIDGVENQLEQLKAQVAQTTGALAVLKNIREYLDKPEEVKPNEEAKVNGDCVTTVNQSGGVTAKNVVVDGYGKYNSIADMETA